MFSVPIAMAVFPLVGAFLCFFISFYEFHKAFVLVFVYLTETLDESIDKRDRCAMKSVLCDLLNYNVIGKE